MHVSITEARAKLSELVRRANAGEEIVITRRGRVVARLLPPPGKERPIGATAALKGPSGLTIN
ncbi:MULTISPECIES: type II toxin-antitoxin system prevent-host-death family antitoxin [Mesorhizobium]|uniref:type II toxin-antitoxin system Phd/YefM family antitoxin n=1 Tax=Mesorhizobium TaxID=68287 RepID=UPI000FCB2794|nr:MULTISPECIES: type II toxin-antitoxin system prevent-host-death family antitoxin [Mesorhizobium]MCQ8813731.1 type II toxin-antitoxin system prevent-host-death family antitoxin [Mesorhizobium sp. SEMIA396]MCQ8876160.1 type II toxin-antitoxin system prevent-host-death family antitoxin [Mesorhizobium sp. LMG17149]RUU59005.1 type II toxin-antitoxin system prevent-host-death family antitoxin [Mesorhizobium sp. M7A.T.Ca.TU.009.01.1.1]RUU83690.1 type II toxin-antitoxin system prevent-host-death fam